MWGRSRYFEDTMKKLKDIALFLLLLISGLWLYDLYQGFNAKPQPVTVDDVAPLNPWEQARVVVQRNTVAVRTSSGSVKVAYVPPSGNAVVTVKKDGTIDLRVKSKGFDLQLGGGYVYDGHSRVCLDVSAFYWNRTTLHIGLGIGPVSPAVVPYVGVGYKLDRLRLDNTSLITGVTLRKQFLVGVVVQF
jgi:hypothetical protein